MPIRSPRRAGMLLATGQKTQYDSEPDDGYYQKGLAKAYTILTLGQYAGTVNVDLIHYTAATIAFVAATKTITDTANGLAIFKTNDVIIITGSVSNNGAYTVATGNVAGSIVVSKALADEAAGASVSIAKREAMSKNCVQDLNTSLMWARDQPTKFGTASNGNMPWTGQLYDIFQFCAAANAASLGGYTDWRVPNAFEMINLLTTTPFIRPDMTAFPSYGEASGWTSTTWEEVTDKAWNVEYFRPGGLHAKTDARRVLLVRGGS